MICMCAENEEGGLMSAFIDSTGDPATMRPAKVLPLGCGHSGTPVIPVIARPFDSRIQGEPERNAEARARSIQAGGSAARVLLYVVPCIVSPCAKTKKQSKHRDVRG